MANSKQNKGITLIVLVITIIVMLILVGVAVATALRGKLFNYAGNAAVGTSTARDKEQNLADLQDGLTTDNLVDKYTTGQ